MKKKTKEKELEKLKYEFAQEMGITNLGSTNKENKKEDKNNSK